MTAIRRFFLWYALLTKRLIRRPAYLAVLLLIPLFALAVMLFSQESSGVITIALCMEDPEDPAASSTVDRLMNSDTIMNFVTAESADEAREAVRAGKVDAAWIFPADLSARLDRFVRYGSGEIITVVGKADSVFLKIAREKLFMALYPDVSFRLFSSFVRNDLKVGDEEDAVLEAYYNSNEFSDEILTFAYNDGTEVTTDESYVVAPVRGILALLLLLCGLASGMYCYREEREESFVWLSPGKRRLLPVLCHITAMVPAALAVLAALALSGTSLPFWHELTIILLYLPAAALFCEFIRCLCPREEHYGALIPVIAIAVLILCPIFLNLNLFLPLRRLLPTGYYLNASFSVRAVIPMLLYLLILIPLTLLASRLREYFLGKQAGKL
jgi:hypothetical protein